MFISCTTEALLHKLCKKVQNRHSKMNDGTKEDSQHLKIC